MFGRGLEAVRAPIQLRNLVNDMATVIRETFPKNITVRRETPPKTWPVNGDATQLHQLLMNLCVNAARRHARRRHAHLEIGKSGDQ